MLDAQVERQYDEYERMAQEAMMMRGAYHAKKLKATDLFKRPKGSVKVREGLTDMKKETERLNDWLATLTPTRKEDANGGN